MAAPVSGITVKIQECWENILPLAAYEGWISLIFALRGGLFEVLRSNMDEYITNHYRCEMPIECGAFVRWLVGSRRGFLIGCGRGSCEGMGSGGGDRRARRRLSACGSVVQGGVGNLYAKPGLTWAGSARRTEPRGHRRRSRPHRRGGAFRSARLERGGSARELMDISSCQFWLDVESEIVWRLVARRSVGCAVFS